MLPALAIVAGGKDGCSWQTELNSQTPPSCPSLTVASIFLWRLKRLKPAVPTQSASSAQTEFLIFSASLAIKKQDNLQIALSPALVMRLQMNRKRIVRTQSHGQKANQQTAAA
jgi:hypothetical protein